MGKYTHLRHKLPSYVENITDPGLKAWLNKVSNWKMKFIADGDKPNGYTANDIAYEYAERDAKKKRLEAEISQLNIELEALSQLGVDAMEDDGNQKVDLIGGGSVSIKDTPYTSTEDRAKLFAWVKKNKLIDLLTLNYQTLSGMNNERLIAGKPLIPGTKVFMKTKLAVRGVNGNGDDE